MNYIMQRWGTWLFAGHIGHAVKVLDVEEIVQNSVTLFVNGL
jgi:hypothetical protein